MVCLLYCAAGSALLKETVARAEAAGHESCESTAGLAILHAPHHTVPPYTTLLSSELSMTLLSFVLAFTSSSLS